jgi:hypothetical protein
MNIYTIQLFRGPQRPDGMEGFREVVKFMHSIIPDENIHWGFDFDPKAKLPKEKLFLNINYEEDTGFRFYEIFGSGFKKLQGTILTTCFVCDAGLKIKISTVETGQEQLVVCDNAVAKSLAALILSKWDDIISYHDNDLDCDLMTYEEAKALYAELLEE